MGENYKILRRKCPLLTYNEVTQSEAIRTYITRADQSLAALGYTEHSFAHVMHEAETA